MESKTQFDPVSKAEYIPNRKIITGTVVRSTTSITFEATESLLFFLVSSFDTVSGAVGSSIAIKMAVILLQCLKLLAVSRTCGEVVIIVLHRRQRETVYF